MASASSRPKARTTSNEMLLWVSPPKSIHPIWATLPWNAPSKCQSMVLSLVPPNRSVQPSLVPTKPLDSMVLPPTTFHGREHASADEVVDGSEAQTMVRPPAWSVRELSLPLVKLPPPPVLLIAGLLRTKTL